MVEEYTAGCSHWRKLDVPVIASVQFHCVCKIATRPTVLQDGAIEAGILGTCHTESKKQNPTTQIFSDSKHGLPRVSPRACVGQQSAVYNPVVCPFLQPSNSQATTVSNRVARPLRWVRECACSSGRRGCHQDPLCTRTTGKLELLQHWHALRWQRC